MAALCHRTQVAELAVRLVAQLAVLDQASVVLAIFLMLLALPVMLGLLESEVLRIYLAIKIYKIFNYNKNYMSPETIVSTIAACLTTLGFVPQAIKAIQSPDTKSISFWMYLLSFIGVIFWMIFGFMIGNYPVIIKILS